jgi:hypothetical protein
MRKKLLLLQTLILAGGLVYSWSRVIIQFQTFYQTYGTILKIKDCTYPNPLATACFYGAVMFLVTFIFSLALYLQPLLNEKRERLLRNLLAFGSVFAASVLTYEFLLYYKIVRVTGAIISCSPGIYPLKTPCFIGLLFFFVSFLVAAQIVRMIPKQNS